MSFRFGATFLVRLLISKPITAWGLQFHHLNQGEKLSLPPGWGQMSLEAPSRSFRVLDEGKRKQAG